ncbi:N-alkane-inducible cytochrome P450 [Histoplasma capsulatum var. duboisii H88]|uniref:N-alkane-inducible cytochrome P450 n=1 Tax=Ajellomyces capsulatus (strain H88) TaxID=544711 RepID=F0URG7_AJEC8|nr:N-alkane-inducible cytochrome P450 [Histoplasma capsulatum var. duboisii H88]QSS50511.1 N-alkane-inducible cytochrome P450 [Histoplasma capsulatum var. duboisii H88]
MLSLIHVVVGAFGCFFLYQVYLYFTVGAARRKLVKEHACRPPPAYPHKDPIFGLDLTMKLREHKQKHILLQESVKRYRIFGNTFSLIGVGIPTISTCEPENIKCVLSLKFSDTEINPLRKTAFHGVFGQGIFTTDGPQWEHSRTMLRPNFNRAQVAELAIFEAHIQNFIQVVPTDGSTVDLQPLFFDLTVDTATEFLFGESANTLHKNFKPSTEENFAEAFTYCTTEIGNSLRVGLLDRYFKTDKRFERDRKLIHDFADRYVKKALENHANEKYGSGPLPEKGRYVFLQELAKQTQDPIALRSETLNILLAGRDTTASLLANVWNIIPKRPDVLKKLRAEVDQLGGRKPTFEELKNMKYLKYVLNECLRLWPVVPNNARVAIRDTILPLGGGPDGKSPVFVKKGTTLAYSVYAMHRRQDIYGPDAAEFRPERWETIRPGWEYLPFNGGPRICLGQQFALTEASYTTVRLMQHFRTIESRDPEPWTEWITITCASHHGAKVSLKP